MPNDMETIKEIRDLLERSSLTQAELNLSNMRLALAETKIEIIKEVEDRLEKRFFNLDREMLGLSHDTHVEQHRFINTMMQERQALKDAIARKKTEWVFSIVQGILLFAVIGFLITTNSAQATPALPPQNKHTDLPQTIPTEGK
jgi:hypothetical protein